MAPRKRAKINKATRKLVFDRDGNKCLACGSKESLTIDHIRPISKGGKQCSVKNLQTLCETCNHDKGDETVDFTKDNWYTDRDGNRVDS